MLRRAGGVMVVAIALVAGGCRDSRPRQAAEDLITEQEAATGRQACSSYVTRRCACTDADIEESCELARGRAEALELALDAAASAGRRPESERWALRENARRIIRGCVEADLELDPRSCPRR